MQVGEQDQVLAQQVVLLLDRLLDLEDEIGLAPHLLRAFQHDGPGCDEIGVGK